MPSSEYIINANVPGSTPAVSADGFDVARFSVHALAQTPQQAIFRIEGGAGDESEWFDLIDTGSNTFDVEQTGVSENIDIDGISLIRVYTQTLEGSDVIVRVVIHTERKV